MPHIAIAAITSKNCCPPAAKSKSQAKTVIYLQRTSWALTIDSMQVHEIQETGKGIRAGGGGDMVPTMPRCVCPKVKDMGPFLASRECDK